LFSIQETIGEVSVLSILPGFKVWQLKVVWMDKK
jgi:hypothetical protein